MYEIFLKIQLLKNLFQNKDQLKNHPDECRSQESLNATHFEELPLIFDEPEQAPTLEDENKSTLRSSMMNFRKKVAQELQSLTLVC